ncbi:MAG TPA: chemotaxis protein CheW [Steroidobacteraceae bacterium]
MIRARENDLFLLCRIGSRIGALAVKDVRETMRPLPIEPLTGTPPFVLGVAIVRGSAVPVIDAGRLLDPSALRSAAITSPPAARFVSLELGDRTAVLAVDAVLDVRPLAAGILAQIPPLLRGAGKELVSIIGALDSHLLLVLEAARLVPDSVWSEIKAAGASA